MSRRVSLAGLILVVTIWTVVLLMPSLRLLLTAQIQPLPGWMYQLFPPRETSVDELTKQHPDDPRILAAQIEDLRSGDSNEDYRKKQLREYDALIGKFPREEWLIQNRLRLSMSGGFAIDTGEMQAQSKRDAHLWLSREEILQALRIAERGARLNPQNSFYDWMRAIFLFSLKRDGEALTAFKQGARKSRYEDGVLHDMQNRDAVRAMQSPHLWEERVSTASGITLPHYANMRRANFAATWRGVLAERKDNHGRALEIYGAQMSLCRLMWRDATPIIGTMVGRAMADEVWKAAPGKREQQRTTFHSVQKMSQNATKFADYARHFGRNDLAKAALIDAPLFHSDNDRQRTFFQEMAMGTRYDVLAPMIGCQWLNSLIVRAVAWSTLSWLLLSSALLLMPKNARHVRVSALDVASSVAFVIVPSLLPFSLIYLALFYAPTDNIWPFMFPMQSEMQSQASNSFFPIINTYYGVLPVALSLFYCTFVMLWRTRRSTPTVDEKEDVARILSLVAFVILIIAFAVWWWEWLAAQHLSGAVTYIGLMFPLLLGWALFRFGKRSLQKRAGRDVVYGFTWCRSTLGALVVLGSMAYLVCALFALPLRQQADAGMDDFIQHGETALMREVASPR